MRHHATPKNLVPSAHGPEPSTCAFNPSRSFIAPLRLRWSPVVLQRKMPSISFFFMPLRDSFLHNDRGTPLPHRSLGAPATSGTSFNSLNFFALIFLRTLLHDGFSQPLLFQQLPHSLAKTTGGMYPSNDLRPQREYVSGLYILFGEGTHLQAVRKAESDEFESSDGALDECASGRRILPAVEVATDRGRTSGLCALRVSRWRGDIFNSSRGTGARRAGSGGLF